MTETEQFTLHLQYAFDHMKCTQRRSQHCVYKIALHPSLAILHV